MMTKIITEAEIYNTYDYEEFIEESLNQRDIQKKVLLKYAIKTAEDV